MAMMICQKSLGVSTCQSISTQKGSIHGGLRPFSTLWYMKHWRVEIPNDFWQTITAINGFDYVFTMSHLLWTSHFSFQEYGKENHPVLGNLATINGFDWSLPRAVPPWTSHSLLEQPE
ncbi:hypothetical protein Tco_1185434 [Tanacetum coccineum]